MSLFANPALEKNLLAAIGTVVFVKAVVGGCDVLVSKGWVSSTITRKIVHVSAGSWILYWPLFTQDHWTWKLNVLVPAVYSVQLFVKGALLRDPNDKETRTMTRTGNPTELLYGPLYFTLVMQYVGLQCFETSLGITIMACLGYGDGLAPLVGTYMPFGRYPTFPFRGETKTLSGSLAFWAASILGYAIFQAVCLSQKEAQVDHAKVLQIITLAAVTEGISGSFDNITVPLCVYLAFKYM